MIQTLSKNIQNETLIFTNQKAIFWEREKTLIISDLHVGKSAHFRKSGIAVSSEILLDDLKVLENLIEYFHAEKLIVVGDLFHAGMNSDLNIFCEWRNKYSSLKIILVKGNHDRIQAQFYEENCIEIIEDLMEIEPFTFVHEPNNHSEKFSVSGHIHPGIILYGKAKQAIKLPCFAISENQIILPAFSKFTGLYTKSLHQNFKFIAFTTGTIFEV